jgi:recombination protein RecA
MSTQKGRADAIKALQKEIEHAFDNDGDLVGLPTGALAVDIITGIGGFPRGRLTEVFGWEGSAKSTLCLTAAATCQASGLYPVYIDIENGVDPTFATRLGFDMEDAQDKHEKGLYLRPDSLEQAVEVIEKMATEGEADLIIADSVPAMTPQSILDGEIIETGRIGELSRLLSSIVPRLIKIIKHKKTALVFCNQMRKTINTGWQPPGAANKRENTESTSGGSALKFYASLRIDMTLKTKGIEKKPVQDLFSNRAIEVPTANLHTAQAFKNKVSIPYRSASFVLRYDTDRNLWGIDNRQTVIDIAVSQGVIAKKTGGRYAYDKDGVTFGAHGEGALYTYLLEHPEHYTVLQAEVLALPEIRAALGTV